MKQLEQWLGAPLVTRAGNRLAMTAQGADYHARISTALAELTRATMELTESLEGPLRLWCVPGLAFQWLAGQLADFERAYPRFSVELKPTESPANLAIHEADVDIRYYRDDDPYPAGGRGLRCFEIARPEVFAVASPELAALLRSVPIRDAIADIPFLHEEDDREWRMWLNCNGHDVPPQLPGARCWQAHLVIAAARRGRGVALASRFLVEEDLISGSLVPVPVANARPVVLGGYVLVAREDRWSTPALNRLRDFLKTGAAAFVGAEN